ncbi:MAG: hypothetical protein M3O23_13235 [Actinomycetota bacterium]|nr:hypothetical protein [Actinomycetota bacterium]
MDDVGSVPGEILIIAIVVAAVAFWIWWIRALVDAVRARARTAPVPSLIWVVGRRHHPVRGGRRLLRGGPGGDRPLQA